MSTRASTAPAPRRRGRPRKFDHATALDAALATFWTRGYGGTSMDELCNAMGMNRPSVYASFGNKDAVYAAAVDHYVRTIGARFLDPLAEPKLAEALAGFYRAVIDTTTGRHGPLGCAVSCTLPAEAGMSRAARAKLAEVLAGVDAAIRARLVRAVRDGELPRDADPRTLAEIVTSGMLGIAIRARAGAGRAQLTRLARTVVSLVVPPSRGARRSSP